MILEVATSLFLAWLIWWIIITYQERKDMPPGPLPLPFIGNMLQLRFGMFPSLQRLSQRYGDIFTLTFSNGSTVFINSGEIAREALVTKRDDVAGRVVDEAFGRLVEGKDIAFQPLGDKHSFRRKVFKSAMHFYSAAGMEEAGERANTAADTLIQAIDRHNGQPFSPQGIVTRCMISSLWKWLTSHEYPIDHPTVVALENLLELMVKLADACFLRNFFPILKYLPSNVNKYLKNAKELRDSVFLRELNFHLQTYTSDARRDLTDGFIVGYERELAKGSKKDIGSIEDVKGLMMTVMGAGTDTTTNVVEWFILFMVLYPEVQKKLHEELDKVVGRERKPQWKDLANLHLLQGTVQEVIRRSSGLPLLSRHAHRDTVVCGYKLRKGTPVIVNVMSINDDPRSCSEPELFRPERYLDKDGKFEGLTRFPDLIPFGAGVRKCPGQSLGRLQAFMFACSLLHHYKFTLADGEAPPSLDPGELTTVLSPKPYWVVPIKRL